MSLKIRIEEDFKNALRNQEELTLSVLRLLKAAILNKEKDKRYKITKTEKDIKEKDLVEKSELTDEEIIDLIFSEIKKEKNLLFCSSREKGKNWPKKKRTRLKS